jgi:hypothetical protein
MDRVVSEFVIPARSGKAFEVRKGQILRITETEGKQVADVNAWNRHDYRERMDVISSMFMGRNFRKMDTVHSNRYNLMFTVISDKVGVNFFGTHCAPLMYERLYQGHPSLQGHANCFDILTESVKPFGLTRDDIHDCYNVFMRVDVEEDGNLVIRAPASERGDFVEWRAEMDCLLVISACPGDIAPTNDYQPKALGIMVLERA